ncbi:hypothetical protein HPB52_019710 [Rhipicephalus sanguineus]|uniref:Peptidase C1A papain C-terminal domain-containing protein n=1 Tax=Rhipicephalus sanguineus TaxID=34632 RepID=A0A9D4SZV4_RHISA|nr:hypothetical protein HPB52_019710 [Rhipicephalus sanguineus]
MKLFVVCALFLAAAQGHPKAPSSVKPSSDEMINFINNLNTTWKAGRNFDENIPMSYVKGLMGVHADSKNYRLPLHYHAEIPSDLPESFDAREHWSHCSSIHLIRDLSTCGSCWAGRNFDENVPLSYIKGLMGVHPDSKNYRLPLHYHAEIPNDLPEYFDACEHWSHCSSIHLIPAEAISDRICIHTKGRVQVNISAEELLTRCHSCGGGCNGGIPAATWQFYKEKGVVTGGLYGTEDGCQPYYFPPCEHFTKGALPPCEGIKPTPKCVRDCRKGYEKSYTEDKHYGNVLNVHDQTQIKTEVFKNGPVEAAFTVYADFPSYKSGYFKILRGKDECDIEDDINAGIPKEAKAY